MRGMSRRSPARRGSLTSSSLSGALGLVTAISLGLGLAGCSGSDAPPQLAPPGTVGTPGTPDPSSPSGTAPSATADPSWPPIPAAAKAHTPAGAEAFARYYFTALNYAFTHPDPTIFDSIALPGCKSCANHKETAEGLSRHGWRYLNAPEKVVATNPDPAQSKDTQDVSVVFRSVSGTVVNANNQVVDRKPKDSAIFSLHIKWETADWRVAEIYVSEVGK
jgi:hypothetical protein